MLQTSPTLAVFLATPPTPKPPSQRYFQDFWTEMASRLRYNLNVIFVIMNERHKMPTQFILQNDQPAIDGIRSTGAQQLILVPENGFTGAGDWTNSSGTGLAPKFDLDSDFGGTHNACVSADFGVQNIQLATDWLEQYDYRAFLSEFSGGSNEVWFEALDNLIGWLETHDSFVEWSYWAGGPLWGDCFLSVEPDEGPEFNTTWLIVLLPHIESHQPIKRFGISK